MFVVIPTSGTSYLLNVINELAFPLLLFHSLPMLTCNCVTDVVEEEVRFFKFGGFVGGTPKSMIFGYP